MEVGGRIEGEVQRDGGHPCALHDMALASAVALESRVPSPDTELMVFNGIVSP